jgi:hypothetical protein
VAFEVTDKILLACEKQSLLELYEV